MVKIDIKMPKNCNYCPMCQIAFDSELFNDEERYCCIRLESVEEIADNKRAEFCPLIEE